MNRDPSLDDLLALDGEAFFVSGRHTVRFRVTQIPASKEKPHGLDYSLTFHRPDGERIGGFDNAHRVKGHKASDPRQDHKHRFKTVRPYDYQDAATLLADFWALVDQLIAEEGIKL